MVHQRCTEDSICSLDDNKCKIKVRILNPSLWISAYYKVNAAGMLTVSARDQIEFGSSNCDVLHMEFYAGNTWVTNTRKGH
jgi:hypothetical protein